jgi:hypothetical protein
MSPPEQGLFKRMRQISAEYKNRIADIQARIDDNDAMMDQLQQQQ